MKFIGALFLIASAVFAQTPGSDWQTKAILDLQTSQNSAIQTLQQALAGGTYTSEQQQAILAQINTLNSNANTNIQTLLQSIQGI